MMETLRLRAEIVRNWKPFAIKIAIATKKILLDAKVYVFGSVVRGDFTGGSDVDILIVSNNLPKETIKRAEIKVKIEDAVKLPFYHPFEIHLATPEEAEYYYKIAGKCIIEL